MVRENRQADARLAGNDLIGQWEVDRYTAELSVRITLFDPVEKAAAELQAQELQHCRSPGPEYGHFVLRLNADLICGGI